MTTTTPQQQIFIRARHSVRRQLKKIERAVAEGKGEKARRLFWYYLKSNDARVVAVLKARGKLKKKPSDEEVLRIAERLDAWRGTDEEVWLQLQRKPNGDLRPILTFGVENKSLQYLVRPILKIYADLDPMQFAVRGGGRSKACSVIWEAIKTKKFKWSLSLDIKDCYSSFDQEAVAKRLPLPRRVTLNVVTGHSLNIKFTTKTYRTAFYSTEIAEYASRDCAYRSLGCLTDQILQGWGRQGIPQGSASSPLVAEMLLANICSSVPSGYSRAQYADDLLVLTRTRREGDSLKLALLSVLERHPVGPLLAKHAKVRRICDGSNFLGYDLRYRRGVPQVEPSKKSFAKYATKRNRKIRDDFGRGSDLLEETTRYVRDWSRSFSLWPDVGTWAELQTLSINRLAEGLSKAR